MTTVVRPAETSRRLAWISFSVCVSSAEVASSNSRIARRLQDRAGDRHPLLLAAGELQPALADHGLVAVGQRC